MFGRCEIQLTSGDVPKSSASSFLETTVGEGSVTWNLFFEWFGKIAIFLFSAGGIGLWLGKIYIDKWLSKRFQSQLDALKHVQAQEIERLRAKIAGMLDRATKLHQHEFEVLPEAWMKLATSMGSASSALAALQQSPDAGAASLAELEVILARTAFEEHEKQAVRDETNRFAKTKLMSDLWRRYGLRDALNDRQEFHNYIILKGVFIEPQVSAKMMELSLLTADCLYDQLNMVNEPESFKPREFTANREKWKAAGPLKDEIQKMVSDRLWSASTLSI